METQTLRKTDIAKALGVSHSAVVQWEQSGRIPAERCMELEPILSVPAKELYDNPNILFSMFHSPKNAPKTSRAAGGENARKEEEGAA